jgi:hypothetical protein
VKNQSFKLSTEFLNKTIQVWQLYCPAPLSLNDAREITENMTALFNFLIASEKKSQDKSINKKGGDKNTQGQISQNKKT